MSDVIESYPFKKSNVIELREFEFEPFKQILPVGDEQFGIVLDTEATDKDPIAAALIQIALVPIAFNKAGMITQYGEAKVFLEDPMREIPEKITKLTGTTKEMVQGKRLLEGEIYNIVREAKIVISHNASYDRQLVENRGLSFFEGMKWGCSYVGCEWKDKYECAKLGCLCRDHLHRFFEGHRADNDCYATVELLKSDFGDRTVLRHVLDQANTTYSTIIVKKPSDLMKVTLEDRGYKWRKENGAWLGMVREIPAGDEYAKETKWLSEIGCSSIEVASYGPRVRFSKRITASTQRRILQEVA